MARTCRHGGRPILAPWRQDISSICTTPVPSPVPLATEVAWVCELIRANAHLLNRFLADSAALERLLLQGNFNECLDIIREIESYSGASIWAVENRIAILQRSGGLEAQKEYASLVRMNRTRSDVFGFMVHNISYRAEDSVTAFRFTSFMKDYLDNQPIPKGLNEYLSYRLACLCPNTHDGIASILRHEQVSSPIDLYDTFVDLVQYALTSGQRDVADIFLNEVVALVGEVNDPKLKLALFSAGMLDGDLPLAPMNCSIQYSYYNNDIDLLVCAIEAELPRQPDNIALIYHKAMALTKGENPQWNANSLTEELCQALYSIAKKDEGFGRAVSLAFKLPLIFRTHGWTASVYAYVMRELTSDPFHPSNSGLVSFLDAKYLDPRHCLALGDHGAAYLEQCEAQYGHNEVVDFFRMRLQARQSTLEPCERNFSGYWRMVSEVETAIGGKEYARARQIAEEVEQCGDARAKWWAARYICHCLLAEGDVDGLVGKIVDVCLSNINAIHMLPIEAAAKEISKGKCASGLDASILIHMYLQYFEDRQSEPLLRYAFEDYLDACEVSRPSELRSIYNASTEKMVYFLRYIAKQDVMDLLPCFETSSQVDEERVEICSWLVALDNSSREAYQEEIKEITTSLIVRAGVRLVDRSRIFVDTSGLRRWAEKTIKEDFNRYISFLRAGIGFSDDGFTDAIIGTLEGKPLPSEYLTIPKGEAQAVLTDLVKALLREFLHNPDHGLDSYLSLRIRHGTLAGQLRAPLEDEHLITQKEGTSRAYKPNRYWLDRLTHLDPTNLAKIEKALSDFSKGYDSVIDMLLTKEVHIKTTQKPDGLFQFPLTALHLRAISSAIKEDTDFSKFFDVCMDMFWTQAQVTLDLVRARIDVDMRRLISGLFEALQKAVSSISHWDVVELESATKRAYTAAQEGLTCVVDWFRVVDSASANFQLEHAIAIGIEAVKKIHIGFNPCVCLDIPEVSDIAGTAVTSIADILFIIFDNIYEHSGNRVNPQVDLSVIDLGNSLRFRVVSEVAPGVRTQAKEEKLERIREKVSGDAYKGAVSAEGGTGFPKLRKLAGRHGDDGYHLEFGYLSDQKFLVELTLNFLEVPNERADC
ncbi:hypothetical protein [Phaeospirillum tilakii]|uniref:Histidine kinase-, DNA gyrase B-, and HSP90-like ATPase n=1 Tax=Phaeospirillum tilakii TaxID=741673 RepID=A0ABW5C890_9PROT